MKRRRVAIIGKSSTTRDEAPFGSDSWELWSLGHDYFPGIARAFEMHRRSVWQPDGDHGLGIPHADFLKTLPVPVYMPETHADIPNGKLYPVEEIRTLITGNLRGPKQRAFKFESSVSWMLGKALHESDEIDTVGLWGVDLAIDSEYWYQLPNAVLIIGLLMASGVKVYIPKHLALLEPFAEVDYGQLEEEDPLHRHLQDPMIRRKAVG